MEYKKGTKGFCGECGELMFVFATDIMFGSVVSEAMFEKDQGQGPWVYGEKMECRSCKEPWGFPFLFGTYVNKKMPQVKLIPPIDNS